MADVSVKRALLSVDRGDFVRSKDTDTYEDFPLAIGLGMTISQPTTVVKMLSWLNVKPGMKVLDVGSGSGWTTGLLSALVGSTGFVYGVEVEPSLVEFGRGNLDKYSFTWASIRLSGNGLMSRAPYDRILVSAAGKWLPKYLLDQLSLGGRMVVPVRNSIFVVEKLMDGTVVSEEYPGFVFVEMV
ncbi:protein-L-isoaspartate carboxylmethyltransferase [Candidatus Woesearchaeota archaeon]|nr:protein-L-isoaspartate carboxylmethyltransferase [Candidatus Woesearchaeota archaeon]